MSEHERVISRRTGRGGRPSKGPRTFVGLRLPDQLHEAVEEARAESGLTTNDFCIGLTQRAMEAGRNAASLPSGKATGDGFERGQLLSPADELLHFSSVHPGAPDSRD